MHQGYHAFILSKRTDGIRQCADREGRLRPIFVSRLEMDLGVARAKAWCSGKEHGDHIDPIMRHLPGKWAGCPKRCSLALLTFEVLCEGRWCHPDGSIRKLGNSLRLSTDTLNLYRLDFFLLVAASILDDDAWAEALSGRDAAGNQVTEPEVLADGRL
jgi:hypothetical protein